MMNDQGDHLTAAFFSHIFKLKYSYLRAFQVNTQVRRLPMYICTYIFFFRFSSIIVYYTILNIVPWAIQ